MVKKKSVTTVASSTSGGAAAKPPSIPPKGGAPSAPPPAPAPPAPPSLVAKPGDWTASTVTKRDEKRSRSLGLISSTRECDLASQEDSIPLTSTYTPLDADHPPPELWRRLKLHPRRDQSAASPMKTISSTGTKVSSSLRPRKLNLMLLRQPLQLPKLQLLKQLPQLSFFPLQGEGCSCRRHDSSFCVISSLEAFASQFTSLEANNVRLQEEVKSSSSKLDGAIKKAAMARQEVDSLKEELGKLKERLEEEETQAAEKDELLRQSSLALLEAANIPAAALDTVPNNSPANGVSMALASHQLTRELLEKGKGALARMHQMIFPKLKQDKTLGQLKPSRLTPRRLSRFSQCRHLSMTLRVLFLKLIGSSSEIAADVEWYALTELHKATESLNFPPTLLTLMSEFRNAKKIRDLVRAQVFAGARFTLALVLACYPSASLLSIANATGDLEVLYPKVLLPANIIVDRLEKDSQVPEEREAPRG
ncbi:hypothetical protein QYE76_004212 [Lolium multiflorum]|uniref:Uncharacterized protein n=1 Tax=Lolium multiflorum TaxID=4521 RepID=A0AAD8VZZ9_LOLMU|nr:hypothetical protein QYE76_004212 [Lolium multiflorum]